jgi:hypothetical protein
MKLNAYKWEGYFMKRPWYLGIGLKLGGKSPNIILAQKSPSYINLLFIMDRFLNAFIIIII